MALATRTLGPLHFEDLDPHRFEDLVRALLYDFRTWLKLEGTGRGGGDDGFDVRGWEASRSAAPADSEADEAEEEVDFLSSGRLWVIQCKREKTIGPAKLTQYLNDIPEDQRKDLDAILFVAACEFSKKARDAFRVWCVGVGISEYHIWGKAEIEDLLFQPKNDNLLFAFFGISLQVRKRSIKTAVRARLATKRKIAKLVGGVGSHMSRICLFRDPTDDRYPYIPEGGELFSSGSALGCQWFLRSIIEVGHDGIMVQFRELMAYLADDGVHWDSIKFFGDTAIPRNYENPWEQPNSVELDAQFTRNARVFWDALPDENRARLSSRGFISYDNILAIDEDGDGTVDVPTIFVTFDPERGPFSGGIGAVELSTREKWARNDSATKVEFFPKEFPEAPMPAEWAV